MKYLGLLLGVLFCAAGCMPEVPKSLPATKVTKDRFQVVVPKDVPNPLVIGLLPVYAPEALADRFAPLASHLGKALQTVVVLEAPESYEEAIEMSARGEVDIGQLSPLAYVEAKKRNPSLNLLVTHIAEGSATYSGYLVGRRSLALRGVEELRQRKLAFANPWSASGFLYAAHFLVSRGLVPGRDLPYEFLGRHDAVLEALSNGQVAVGATFSGALKNAEYEGLDIEPLEIIAKTGRIPFDCWVARSDLPVDMRATVQSVLLNLSTRTPQGRRVLGPLRGINGFVLVDDSHYDPVRTIAEDLERRAPQLIEVVLKAAKEPPKPAPPPPEPKEEVLEDL